MLEIRESMETPIIWRLNNSHGLFWEGRIDANYTIQNKWIRDSKYTSGMNRVSLTITSNLMKIFQEMAEEWRFELKMTRPMTRRMDVHRFPDWVVNTVGFPLIEAQFYSLFLFTIECCYMHFLNCIFWIVSIINNIWVTVIVI